VISKQKFVGVACALVLAATAVACSSSSKSTSSPTSSGTAAPSAAPKGAPIKVGLICSCSGAPGFSDFDVPAADAFRAWANSVNASGGINGHPVQVMYQDDASNPGTAVTAGQTLVSDHVVAITMTSNLAQAWGPAVEQASIPVVGAYSIQAPFGQSPDFYPTGQTNDTTPHAVIAVGKQAGATKFANLYCAESPVCAQSTSLFETAGKQLGVPDVYNASVSATAPNYTAQCVAAKQAGANAMFIGDASAVDDRIASDCASQGYNPIYLTEGAGFGLNQTKSPAISKNLWSQYANLPFYANTPAVQAFNTAMDKYYPGVRENDNVFTEVAIQAWASGLVLEDAIKGGGLTPTGNPTAAEITKGLESLNNDTAQGLSPPLTFAAGKAHNIDCWFTARVQNGTPSVENGGKTNCVSGATP
jgi:branched-chain amino acid transport system substrate-binding protein